MFFKKVEKYYYKVAKENHLRWRIGTMKLTIFGSSGWIGGAVTREALHRGHLVLAVVRDPSRLQLEHSHLTQIVGDVTDSDFVANVISQHDAVTASIRGRRNDDHNVIYKAACSLLSALPRVGIKRLIWVGDAGCLNVEPGVRLVDTPEYPDEFKEEGLAQAEVLELFRKSTDSVDWSYVSPPAVIEHGQGSGHYRIGNDMLLKDDQGESRIAVEDYAAALLDELENPMHIRERFTIAY
jgi:uncharacterized protein